MKAVCPKYQKHNKFVTVAHVMQDWIVDPHGNFIKVARGGDCLEVTHKPNKSNMWVCSTCGSIAKLEEDGEPDNIEN